ncbi:5-hydroxytryptamine receptor 1E [Trichoplax sp. H2]|nr:5-hydroxytryptamine receptor 1E [Trichoplax sp. H2]|eukprot:RDD39515.1 5-hydroxytryptamine receptor 1E [Trichoplax sp. H2]
MNFYNYNASNTTRPFDRHQLAAIISMPVILTNSALVITICSKRKLRTPSNAIICSSCLACMVLAILLTCNAIASFYEDQIQSTFLLCLLNNASELTSSAIITFHITTISLERFFSVIYPFKYQRHATQRNTSLLIVALWCTPIFIIFGPVIITSLSLNGHCKDWSEIEALRIVCYFVLFPIVLFLPPVMTFIAYSAMIYKIFAMTRKIWSQSSFMSNQRQISKYQLMMVHRKALFQMLLLLSIYSLSFFPFFTFYTIYIQSQGQLFRTTTYICYLIAVAYILIHPLLSILFTAPIKEEIRKKFKQLCSSACFTLGEKTVRTPISTIIDEGFKSVGHEYQLDIRKISPNHSSNQIILL